MAQMLTIPAMLCLSTESHFQEEKGSLRLKFIQAVVPLLCLFWNQKLASKTQVEASSFSIHI